MNLPNDYKHFLETVKVQEISYGCGGIRLFSAEEVGEGQIGYALSADGTSFCDGSQGSWRRNWIVIGYETARGDPLFFDTDEPALPVFTAPHGEELWKPELVAASIGSFEKSLMLFARIAEGRRNPVEREKNPLPKAGA